MNTTQPMPLDRTLDGLQLVINLKEMWDRVPDEDQELIRLLRSAKHHLEVGKGECKCGDFTEAYMADNTIWDDEEGRKKIGYGNPPISFCPWCGGTIKSPTEEPQG